MLRAKTVQRHVVVEFVAIREGISGPLFRQMMSCALEQHIPKVAVFRESPGLLQTPCALCVLIKLVLWQVMI